uniref:ATP synthase-coupling factor 6, mitochondrial n=1 Tax=Amblyomma aureolatum TaxID=187763 RepID=A0A1E1WYG7_9ACAR
MALNARVTNWAKQCLTQCKRNYGVSAVLMQKSLDPIQQLFVDKIREYTQKSKSKSELFVDADASITKEYNDELQKAAVMYGGSKGADMTEFPKFDFPEPTLDPINQEQK